MRAATGEVVAPRVEADLDEALRAAPRGDDVGPAMPRSGLQSWQLRYDTALFGAEADDDTVEIRTRSARPRRSTGVSVEALVRREGAASTASRRGAHRRPSPLPRRMRLLVAAVGTAVAAAGTTMVALMPDHGASARTVTGQDHAEARQLGVPSVSADVPDLDPAIPEELAASSRLGAAASGGTRPSLVPKRTEQTGPAQNLDPTPSPRPTPDAESTEDAEPTEETDGTSSRRSKGTESRGSGDRDRGSEGRSGGAGRRG